MKDQKAAVANPLSEVDPSGLLAMRHADARPDAGDTRHCEAGKQLSYSELTDGKFFGTNIGRGNDIVFASNEDCLMLKEAA